MITTEILQKVKKNQASQITINQGHLLLKPVLLIFTSIENGKYISI